MISNPMKSWLDRLLEMAIALAAIGLLLDWAWQLIRPLIPVLLVIAGLGIIVTFVVQRYRSW